MGHPEQNAGLDCPELLCMVLETIASFAADGGAETRPSKSGAMPSWGSSMPLAALARTEGLAFVHHRT
jgi:hypothetical protein